eukprot:GHVO01011040.1.p1 GENE.GHVO01011040.1~~GHVO01011040.1.p1  ORF type:complete len:182 (+),score=29.01 GHVO01011040.1:507-1052(+)
MCGCEKIVAKMLPGKLQRISPPLAISMALLSVVFIFFGIYDSMMMDVSTWQDGPKSSAVAFILDQLNAGFTFGIGVLLLLSCLGFLLLIRMSITAVLLFSFCVACFNVILVIVKFSWGRLIVLLIWPGLALAALEYLVAARIVVMHGKSIWKRQKHEDQPIDEEQAQLLTVEVDDAEQPEY